MKKKVYLISFCLVLFLLIDAKADDNKFIKLFDSNINNKFNIADPRFPSLSLMKNFSNDYFYPAFGASIPLMRLKFINDKSIDFIIDALNYNDMQIKDVGLNLYSAEYYINATMQINFNKHFSFSIGKGHTSHHLLDDAITQSNMMPINFVKDFYSAYLIYKSPKNNSLYAGYKYIYHFLIDKNIGKQQNIILGFNLNYIKTENYMLYVASDVKLKQEYDFKASLNIQTGININKKLRIALNYFNGYSENGQYHQVYQNNISIATYIDVL